MTITVGAGTTFSYMLPRGRGERTGVRAPRSASRTRDDWWHLGVRAVGRRLRCAWGRCATTRSSPSNRREWRRRRAAGRRSRTSPAATALPGRVVGDDRRAAHQATLRCRPTPVHEVVHRRRRRRPLSRVGAVGDGAQETVLFEGAEADVDAQGRGLTAVDAPRVSRRCAPRPDLRRTRSHPGVCTCVAGRCCVRGARCRHHSRCGRRRAGAHAARSAHADGGWMLREAGGPPADDGYGVPLPNASVMRRVKGAFDPEGKLNPGRLPLGAG